MTLITKYIKPDASIADFVESFWLLHNQSAEEKEVVIVPDGRIDLFLSKSGTEPFHIMLLGLETEPTQAIIAPDLLTFAVSFKPLAAEYVLQRALADLLDNTLRLAHDFWGFSIDDLTDFELFCQKATIQIQAHLKDKIDERKRKLFQLIYACDGAMSVKELSENVYWTSRQINRYFSQQYGLSLKAYCNILRFRASFKHIREGKLFPEQNFADQSHFIREIKKLSGVAPKEFLRNKNDRFIQLSTLPES
ncbi:AraC family transcriptional regulator [Emticicia sp. BO119]|uniref:helix-turn-helix domain-containing protein n=1 Tax=Emticicia sp. BO119 TaxID=2757768 RepID=UPI0015F0F646|nr:AraC family transcriptional regulator [Emticicia sp. BO119]MBA4852724.1 helix-turn-helix transcriptional regulator [Emticicia sp. BO119]